jgi:hypothetical protein
MYILQTPHDKKMYRYEVSQQIKIGNYISMEFTTN